MDEDYIHTAGMSGKKVERQNILHAFFFIERKCQWIFKYLCRDPGIFTEDFLRLIFFQGGGACADQKCFRG